MDIIIPNDIQKGIISGKKKKDGKYEKGKIVRIKKADEELIQLSLFTEKQVFHKNYNEDDAIGEIVKLLENDFNNLELFSQ